MVKRYRCHVCGKEIMPPLLNGERVLELKLIHQCKRLLVQSDDVSTIIVCGRLYIQLEEFLDYYSIGYLYLIFEYYAVSEDI